MPVTDDGNGNLFAWWGEPWGRDAVLTGSHFDSVPHGGGFDGPLGIVSAFLAVDQLRAAGHTPASRSPWWRSSRRRAGRFGLPCLGSRLLTGAIEPAEAAALTDRDGVTFGEGTRSDAGRSAAGPDQPDRRPGRAAHRARTATRGAGRGGQRDLAARALAVRLHRARRPRRDHPDGRPARPDADLRVHGAGREQGGPAGRRARDDGPGRGRAERHQRDPVAGPRLAGRAGRGHARRWTRWSTRW
jgi:hypothetical protein